MVTEMKSIMKMIVFECLISAFFYAGAFEFGVVLPSDAVPAEKTAGRELRKYLSEISVRTRVSSSRTSFRFFLGQSPAIAEKLGIGDFASLRPDEILLRRIGNDFYLTGARPRGTLYAVYTFLEDFCGMRFLAPDETLYPTHFSFSDTLNFRYAPRFIMREVPFPSLRLSNDFAAKRKVNGHWQKTSEEWGGHETILGFCHTFSELMPPDKYAKEHPEYYSEINGVRRPVGNQLCLSNSQMRAELIRNIRALLRKNPSAKIISVSQNDNNDYCRCQACNLLAERFGGTQSGILIDCLNEIAGALEKEFPNVYFETLAYAYSVEPPQNIRPRRNVIVRLCADSCDYGQPLNSPANSVFRDALTNWSRLTKRLMVWNYVSLFGNHLIPNPNWGLHGVNLRFFRDHGVIAVFNQAGGGDCGDFAPLRAYVNSKLLWNPDLDEQMLIDEFLPGYYGKDAFPFLRRYLALMKINYSRQKTGFKLTWKTSSAEWLPYDTMEEARGLMERAVAVSHGKYVKRLEQAKIAIDFAFLLHPETSCRYSERKVIPRKILDSFCRRTSDVRHYGEGLNLDRLKKSLAYLFGTEEKKLPRNLPRRFRNLLPDSLIVVESGELTAYENNIRTKRYPDFIRMRADHKCWLIQFPDLAMRTRSTGQWRLFVEIRTGGRHGAESIPVETGIYDAAEKKNYAKIYRENDFEKEVFSLLDLGAYQFSSGKECFFCAPGAVSAGWIDIRRLFLVREAASP